jgi:cytochrome c-type biogenesis protein CcmH/NrfG
MKRTLVVGIAVVLALAALAPRVRAQTNTTAGVRGKVVDEQGSPIPGVKIDFEFKGESRVKVTKSQLTDKKGGYVRVGLPGGTWRLVFSKEGFQNYGMDTSLSAGGYSELPDIVLKAGTASAPAAAKPAANEVAPQMPTEAPATMKDVYNKAVEASRAGNLDEAVIAYKEILEKLPDLAEVHYNLGQVYVRQKDMASAEAEFRRAAELKPQNVDLTIAVAALLTAESKAQEAADVLVKAAPNFEQDAKFQFILGTNCVNAGRNKEAEAAFRKTLELDPASTAAHFYLGTIAVGENRVPEALDELGKFVAGKDQNPQDLATAKQLIDALKKRK